MELERVSNLKESQAKPPHRRDKMARVFVWLFLMLSGCEDLLHKIERIVPLIKQVIRQILKS